MNSTTPYLFVSERLGFRTWTLQDINTMHKINSDPEVMRYFPGIPTHEETSDFVTRMIAMQKNKGYCYYAVEILGTKDLIGFIGIAYQDYEADFTPCIDIGWRLTTSVWGKGYATEGAKACLDHAFQQLAVDKIYAVAPITNIPSIHVMQKIGMQPVKTFHHPRLTNFPPLRQCVLYQINSPASTTTD